MTDDVVDVEFPPGDYEQAREEIAARLQSGRAIRGALVDQRAPSRITGTEREAEERREERAFRRHKKWLADLDALLNIPSGPGFVPNLSVVMPWNGDNPDLYHEAVATIPIGTPLYVAKNEGKHQMAAAINGALEMVKTTYVFIMAADDLLGEGMLEQLAAAIGTADVAYPAMHLFGDKTGEFPADVPSLWRLQDWNFIPGVFLARTALLREVGWRDSPIEDWDLHWRLANHGARYVNVPNAQYGYRIHGKSLSARITVDSAEHEVSAEHVRADITGSTSRVPMIATFYCSGSEAQAWVRGVLPARYLPGVARRTYDEGESHESPMSVYHHAAGSDAACIAKDRERGKSVCIDVDDDYLAPAMVTTLAKTNPALAEQWAKLQPSHRKLVREADAVICATEVLADQYAKVNPNVAVIPNTVDPHDWPTPERLKDGVLRVGWAAGRGHLLDAGLAEDALRWVSRQPGMQAVVIGLDPEWDFDYHWQPFTPSGQVYRDVLSVLDVGIAPLRGGRMNAGKSDLKALDYTMAGAACVLQDRAPYYAWRDGDTCLKATTKRDFLRSVQTICTDDALMYQLAQNAAGYVARERLARHMADRYRLVALSLGAITIEEKVAA